MMSFAVLQEAFANAIKKAKLIHLFPTEIKKHIDFSKKYDRISYVYQIQVENSHEKNYDKIDGALVGWIDAFVHGL